MKITEILPSTLSEEITDFGPIECMNCEFDGNIPVTYLLVEPEIESEQEYDQLKTLIKEKYGHDSFMEMPTDNGQIISLTRCPKCNSEEIFQDF